MFNLHTFDMFILKLCVSVTNVSHTNMFFASHLIYCVLVTQRVTYLVFCRLNDDVKYAYSC